MRAIMARDVVSFEAMRSGRRYASGRAQGTVRTMQTNYLKYFVDVAKLGSISAASNEDFITPQGMSRSLSVLETTLGCQLLQKHQGRNVLTKYGEALLDDAKEILRIQQRMIDRVAEIRSSEAGMSDKTVLVYLNNVAFDMALFSPLIDSFEQIFANARYYQCDNQEVVDNLLEKTEDDDCVALGLLCLFSPDDERNALLVDKLRQNGFEYQPYLLSYDQVLVSRKSELAAKRSLSHADILSRPIVSSDGDIKRVAEKLFGKNAIYMTTKDSSFRFRVVANDEAITFVPAFHQIMGPINDSTVAVQMKDPYYLEVGFAAKREVLDSPYIKSLIANLNAYYFRYVDSPYLSLIPSDITSFRFSEADRLCCEEKNLKVLEERYGITSRESEVLALLLEGLTARSIADKLFVSVPTAKSHIYRIYKKMGIHSQEELMVLAEEESLAANRCEGSVRSGK